jgi:glyceraldehyde-3-phosphate dehydrogenase (NADP+)
MLLKILILVVFFCISYANEHSSCVAKASFTVKENDSFYSTRPNVNGAKTFYNGEIKEYTGFSEIVTSPIFDESGTRTVIGTMAQMKPEEIPDVIEGAKKAWNNGQGEWPQMTLDQRIMAIQKVVNSLKARRDEIVNVLMWEICKTLDDARAEFDRTMTFIESTIAAIRDMEAKEGDWISTGGILAKIRRMAIGIMLCLGPFNYPFNETYATLIPALLMGNIVIMKIPTIGGLAHVLTMEAYAAHLPAGTMNFVSGSGRLLLTPIMKSGIIDVLAFIGGSKAADAVIRAHPQPHRLKSFLQLEGKNLGIVFPDANLDIAAEQILIGSTTYNGQRCTAIKLILLHESIADKFLERFLPKINNLKIGLPWESGVSITPLPEENKVASMKSLVEDALNKGATLLTPCEDYGSAMNPTVVMGVTDSMRLWHEEQFGPVIPIAIYHDTQEVLSLLKSTPYGQQAAVFTTFQSSETEAAVIDAMTMSVGRININTQCGRSPDILPFSGRRSSALGTMSVSEALKTFSIEVVLAAKNTAENAGIMGEIVQSTKTLAPLTVTQESSLEL